MMQSAILPQPGPLFRALVLRAGYRRRLTERGRDKDLDDLAAGKRPTSSCDLLAELEAVVLQDLAADCGESWARSLRDAWDRTRTAIQLAARTLETGPMADETGREQVESGLEVPLISAMLGLLAQHQRGMALEDWWARPVAAWVRIAAARTALPEKELVSRLHVTPRTTERWMAGEPIRDLQWPFRSTLERAIEGSSLQRQPPELLQWLTGWLMVSVAFQSLPAALRLRVRADHESRRSHPWSLERSLEQLAIRSRQIQPSSTAAWLVALPQRTAQDGLEQPPNPDASADELNAFQCVIDAGCEADRRCFQPVHDWYAARLATAQGHTKEALNSFASAVEGAWWRAGPVQRPMLREALLYAVGVGDTVAAKTYWDKIFMLGLNRWPKRALDDKEWRRLSMAFESHFAPLRGKERVPHFAEFLVRDGPFEVTAGQLKYPNRKVKQAEGRTRRTPLMEAVCHGSLSDVDRLVAAGGDPDDHIPESGEGPLSYAMRRACDRDDPSIMNYLLSLDLSAQTVNRPASTGRETPLKIAIEMADATAVERLIVLGADVEADCDLVPSALCFAMLLLYGSIHRDDRTHEQAYFAGDTAADRHDAKRGAALDLDVAQQRRVLQALRDASPRHRALYEALRERMLRPAEPRRRVLRVLLDHGANANRRYRVQPHDHDVWTPTLFAAEIGDLEVFKMLLAHGGDPHQTLMEASAFERLDALWISVAYQRQAVTDFLIRQETAPAA